MWTFVWMLLPFTKRGIWEVIHIFEGKVTCFGLLSLTCLRNIQKEYSIRNMSRRKLDIWSRTKERGLG